jgi:hypothetical protein
MSRQAGGNASRNTRTYQGSRGCRHHRVALRRAAPYECSAMSREPSSNTQTGAAPTDAVDAARTFGVLATRLTDALGRARAAVEPHSAIVPDGTLTDCDALLTEFAQRRIHVAIYGEVKAGKSTLLNAIAGAALSPVGFDPLTSVPLRVTYGPDTLWRIGDRQLASVDEVERAMRDGITAGSTPPEVVVETDLDLLQLGGQVDLLDTPGLGTASQFDAVSAGALRSLDAVVLVVRYPALFTQFTRRLMESLEADIGKLFVVWNLDADCVELSEAERARHAETLRVNVAGAHELFLVDARAGFRAVQAEDPRGIVASGLTAFIAALARFASSGAREVTALREAAKRARGWLQNAHDCLRRRHTSLERLLADTRARLRAVQAKAEADSAVARRQLADFEAAVDRIGAESTASGASHAAAFRRSLRAARRRWAYRADMAALAAAIAHATARYAEDIHSCSQTAIQHLHSAAARFDVALSAVPRARTEPGTESFASEERIARAAQGRAQRLRRFLWQGWYLPGVVALERAGVAADLAAQAAWWNATAAAARRAAAAVLATRLAEIANRAETERKKIETETGLVAAEAEFESMSRHLPVITAQLDTITQLGGEARALHHPVPTSR